MAARDLTGERFGRLVAVALDRPDRHGIRRWFCRCDCGGSVITQASGLTSGRTKGCGCLRRERALAGECARKHGEGGVGKTSAEYEIWKGMKARCHYPKHVGFAYYGGRGIRVCPRWFYSYDNFLADMGRRPSPDHSIDRIDNDGPYSPDNCRWATDQEQSRGRDFGALGKKGGKARHDAMTPEQRVELARMGGLAAATKQTPEQRRANAAKANAARWNRRRRSAS